MHMNFVKALTSIQIVIKYGQKLLKIDSFMQKLTKGMQITFEKSCKAPIGAKCGI